VIYGAPRRRRSVDEASTEVLELERSTGELDQLLGFLARAEDGHARDAAADHGDFVATVKTRADLAVLEYLVGQLGFVFNNAEAILEEEVRDAREEAHRLNSMQLRFFNQRAENAAAGTLAFGLGLDDDGADLA